MLYSPKYTVERKPLIQSEVAPVSSRIVDRDTLFLDFGRAVFGTLLMPVLSRNGPLIVHLGEKLAPDGRIDRNPPGTIRYIRISHEPDAGQPRNRIIIPADKRNTGPAAIRMPDSIGEVFPFRYAEIENASDINPDAVRQVFVHYPFNDEASSFHSSDPVLNAVWDICKHTIKATTFCGVYVDGDRERIPYEGDAYINQLGHYCVDREYALARYTHEYLVQHPTWPTEWHLHSVLMAWADYIYSGETASLRVFYPDLCAKTLIGLAREDGLISTKSPLCTRTFEESLHLYHPRYLSNQGLRDLVDWPPGSFTQGGQGERDGHEMLPVNTVVNAFHFRALVLMARVAGLLGKQGDASRFSNQAELVKASLNRLLFNQAVGAYVDGEGSSHCSLHSSMFMLALGAVPEEKRKSVTAFVKSRGMACSVYGAQYLLESMYLNGEEDYAFDLMTARHDRGWWHMIESGSTMTWEAWDHKYKNNLDWNHAWGAAPANIIPRFILGVRPLGPGFTKVLINPQPGPLTKAEGIVPTPRGPVEVSFRRDSSGGLALQLKLPESISASVALQQRGKNSSILFLDGKPVSASLQRGCLSIEQVSGGTHTISERS